MSKEYTDCLESSKKLKLCKRGYCSAKQKFDVYPSAYANIFASRVCRGELPDFEGKIIQEREGRLESGLQRWLDEKWVNVCAGTRETGYPPCGRSNTKTGEEYPYCRPSIKINEKTPKTVGELTDGEIEKMCALKHSMAQGIGGKPRRIYVDKSVDLKSMTVLELRSLCKQYQLEGCSRMKKQELIELLEEII